MTLNKTACVILGMLELGRRTGYEIKSLVDVSVRFFWAASYGQIYPELRRLEEAGLVTGTDDHTDGRRRRAYDPTPAGEEALREWLTSSAPLTLEMRHEGALKVFFADVLQVDEQIALLRSIRAEHERQRDALRALEPGVSAKREAGKQMPERVLEWGLALNEFHIDWCERLERELAEQELADERR